MIFPYDSNLYLNWNCPYTFFFMQFEIVYFKVDSMSANINGPK